jgi:hypothetical protein
MTNNNKKNNFPAFQKLQKDFNKKQNQSIIFQKIIDCINDIKETLNKTKDCDFILLLTFLLSNLILSYFFERI